MSELEPRQMERKLEHDKNPNPQDQIGVLRPDGTATVHTYCIDTSNLPDLTEEERAAMAARLAACMSPNFAARKDVTEISPAPRKYHQEYKCEPATESPIRHLAPEPGEGFKPHPEKIV